MSDEIEDKHVLIVFTSYSAQESPMTPGKYVGTVRGSVHGTKTSVNTFFDTISKNSNSIQFSAGDEDFQVALNTVLNEENRRLVLLNKVLDEENKSLRERLDQYRSTLETIRAARAGIDKLHLGQYLY